MSNNDLDDRIIAALSVYNSFLVGKNIIDSEDEIYKIGNAFLNLYSVVQDFKKQKEELVKALEPFAKVGELFCADAFPGAVENRDACIYRPAKGQDWEISSGHLIDARQAIIGEVMIQNTTGSNEQDIIQAHNETVTELGAAKQREEDLLDKIDALESELSEAVSVAYQHGAHDWTRHNYPGQFKFLENIKNVNFSTFGQTGNLIETIRKAEDQMRRGDSIRTDTGIELIAKLDALVKHNKELITALDLASHRLHRCALDYETGSNRFYETVEWVNEARLPLKEKS